jgi:hypothetical protein
MMGRLLAAQENTIANRCWHAELCSASFDGDLSNRYGQLASLAILLSPKGKPCPNGHKRDDRNLSGLSAWPQRRELLGLHLCGFVSDSVMQSASVTASVL